MRQQQPLCSAQQQASSSTPVPAPAEPAVSTARLSLRYRPVADVLIGVIEPTILDEGLVESVEVLDADARLVWNVASSGPFANTPMLASFELMHALSRWEADGLSMLSANVADACMQAARQHAAAVQQATDPRFRLGYRGQDTLEFPLTSFARSSAAPAARAQGSQVDALHVARALESFADGIEAAEAAVERPLFHDDHGNEFVGELDHSAGDGDTGVESGRATAIANAARELACALADHDARPAPGTSAAMRRTLRGGLPLGFSERRVLLQALTDVDHASNWPAVASAINSIATALHATAVPPDPTPNQPRQDHA